MPPESGMPRHYDIVLYLGVRELQTLLLEFEWRIRGGFAAVERLAGIWYNARKREVVTWG